MAYRVSKTSTKLLKEITSGNKDRKIRLKYKASFLQRSMDAFCFLLALAIPILYFYVSLPILLAIAFIGCFIFGIREFFIQHDHALIRIYGPFGRLRYLFENEFRDKYLQYFNETNVDGRPIPRIVRDYVYQKAHNVKALTSFGTELDIFDTENSSHARILHSNFPGEIQNTGYGLEVGAKREGVRPFHISNTINVSAMSYGSLNYRAAEAISIGSKGVGYVNCGEGGLGPHGVAKNDIVYQIGTGKFGVGEFVTLSDGTITRKLNEKLLVELVKNNDNVRMLQIKISQGAKPGMGGVLPGSKVTPEIAEVRKVEPYQTIHSPPQHYELLAATSKEAISNLMDFIERLRKLTNLPVGIKFCVGRLREIDDLVAAMKATGKGPDAIQIDGADGGTGAGPNLFVNYVGYGGAIETLHYLDKKLKEAGLRDEVILSASGRILTPVHAALAFAYGADVIDTARGIMLALGCIQALKCHSNSCPTGITTNQPWRVHGINIPEKSARVHCYLKGFHEDMLQLTKVMQHQDPRDITPEDIRLITYRDNFAGYFEEDPFGLKVPTYQS
ncbi:MAG: FMN-binding glutamate synthase family protein [Spirochaetota bacterium]